MKVSSNVAMIMALYAGVLLFFVLFIGCISTQYQLIEECELMYNVKCEIKAVPSGNSTV